MWGLLALLAAGCAPPLRTASRTPAAAPPTETPPTSLHLRPSIRPVATYSIVARDGSTGELGVAVQSHWFSVGSVVPWAESGVGAVATQSLVEVSYGPLGLDLMRAGKTAPQALAALTAADPGQAYRQVAMVDASGNVATHTGDLCIAHASHKSGKARDGSPYSAQANMMDGPGVPDAMSAAFESSTGPLADRLLAALDAAQTAGGDIRGRQSAAMLIVRAESTGKPWEDRLVDLRVEDSPEPLVELRRLVHLQRAYQHMNAGDAAMEHKDTAAAMREYQAALADAPTNTEMAFWVGVALVNAEKDDEALPYFARAFADPARGARWLELAERLPKSKLMRDDAALLRRIRAQLPK